MVNVERLCRGCMRLMPEGEEKCPVCGYDRKMETEESGKCLSVDTILNGRYLLGSVLGEGGFGITYIAFDLIQEEAVAIKEYFPVGLAVRNEVSGVEVLELPGEAGMHFRSGLRRFRQEGENLSKFQSLPGIVTIRDFFSENGTAYLVMDFIEGRSLKQYMQWYQRDRGGESMEYTVALALMEPVMESLAKIHGAGIIHRDVSPDNILVNEEGKVTLIDFGSARTEAVGQDYRSVTVMVKHGYAPEEQYRTHGNQGPWTDVYALSATLYHMISGKLPMEAVERLYHDELIPLKQLNLPLPVPGEISDIIEKGMAVRAEKRYQGMEEMYQALKEARQREAERLAQEEAQREAERLAWEAAQQESERLAQEAAKREAERLAQEAMQQETEIQEQEMPEGQPLYAETADGESSSQTEEVKGNNLFGILAIAAWGIGMLANLLWFM
ncbi:MAG: protein kinase [Clostridiales bacterium]|nr:protein kinase [Clostridiales bacterium]